MSLAAGTRLDHYKIIALLGAGGMGEVYVAEDVHLGRRLALKLLPARSTQDLDRVRRFKQEARAASALNHPNIVTIHEIGESDAGHFIAMELVQGRTVRQMIGPLCEAEHLVKIARQIAEALRVAHGAGITHRDIKPENVMVRHDGYVKVLDFGVARLIPTSGAGMEHETMTATVPGKIPGTLLYMSPEQLRQEPVTGATDVFSFGLLLYELATAQHPFASGWPLGVLHAILTSHPLAPSRLNLGIPTALDELILRMLAKESRLRPTAGEVESALADLTTTWVSGETRRRQGPSVTRHTVGREKERAELRASLDLVKSGHGRLLCVSGEPGVGKTTLVEDFLTDLVTLGESVRVARGRCSERLAGTEAYLPWLEALDGLLRSGGSAMATRAMKVLAPTWYSQMAPSSHSDSTVQPAAERAPASQERLKRELTALMQELSRVEPLVLFFDDLHWADLSTIDLLAFLADRFDHQKLLIVATYRPSDLLLAKHPFARLKQTLQSRGVCHDLPLEFLSRDDIEQYLALEFPEHRFPSDLPARLHARTEGSPLFMADLIGYLRGRKVIAQEQGRWVMAQPLGEVDRDLPESVRGMIDRKIAQLGDDDRRLLAAASVQGYEFDSAALTQALGAQAAEVEERLEVLERVFAFVRLVDQREFPDHTLTLRYRFVHVLYQNALYGSLRPTRRAQLAGALAAALEAYWGAQNATVANELAVLFETAREWARAADYFRLAARNASELFASQEAVALARRGLAMIELLPPGRERLERELSIQVVLGNGLMATRGYAAPEVEQTYLRAGELCQQLGETPHLLPVLFGVYAFHVVRANLRKALEVSEEFMRRVERQPGPAVIIGHRMVGGSFFYMGNLPSAREHLERAVALYDPAQHRSLTWLYGQEPGTVVRSLLAMTLWLLGYPDQALVSSQEARRLGRDVSHAHTHAQVLAFAGMQHQFRGEWPRVREIVDALIDLANEQGLAFWSTAVRPLRGAVMAAEGQVAEGIDEMRSSLRLMQSFGAELFQPYSRWLLADACARAGQREAALTALEEAQTSAERNEERYWEPEIYRSRGELLWESQQKEAEPCLLKALDLARRQQARSLELRAAISLSGVWQQQGKRVEARELLTDVYTWFTEGFDTADLTAAKARLQELS